MQVPVAGLGPPEPKPQPEPTLEAPWALAFKGAGTRRGPAAGRAVGQGAMHWSFVQAITPRLRSTIRFTICQGQALSAAERDGEADLAKLLPRRSMEPTASVLLTGLSGATTEAMVPEGKGEMGRRI